MCHSAPPRQSLEVQDRFLQLLPGIRQYAAHAFRSLPREAREDAVAEVIANAFVAFQRLVERDRADRAYATVLARYGVAQYDCGRRVGTSTNSHDLMSPTANRKRLRAGVRKGGQHPWQALVVADRSAGPAEVACFRIDFQAWLSSLTARQRRIASDLALGDTTSETAHRHLVSAGRVSQIRRELAEAWKAFQGEPTVSCSGESISPLADRPAPACVTQGARCGE